MKKLSSIIALGALLTAVPDASGAIRVVATTQDLAALAREIGGDKVTVEAIASGRQDPHFVEPKPSFILRLSRADLLLLVGRELEAAWLPALVTQSRNARIQPGAEGYLDASQNVKILDLPTGAITRAMGDVHPQGNPHYWLDPGNGRRIAQTIQARLSKLAPGDASYFAGRYAAFDRKLAEAEARWRAAAAGLKGLKVVTYHRSWSNFADAFGLDVIGYVEPKPGIPPSPAHTLTLIDEMKRQKVRIIMVEPYFDLRTPNMIARETGARVVVMPPSVGGTAEATGYIELFDHNLKLLTDALTAAGGR